MRALRCKGLAALARNPSIGMALGELAHSLAEKRPAPTIAEPRGNPLVLVIDDDPLVRATVEEILDDAGYASVAASNGLEGLSVMAATKPNLVITDLIMPEMEGIQTIVAIRRKHPEAKIIAISGGARRGDLDFLLLAQRAGADDALAKPFHAHELVACVRGQMGAPLGRST